MLIGRTMKELGIDQNLLASPERRRKELMKMIRMMMPISLKYPDNQSARYSVSILVLLIAK